MLFDLSSRRHRRLGVQVVCALMVLLIAGGLILFGVGTGSSGGGLFGAFTGNSSTGGNSTVTKAVTKAEAAVKKNPKSASAWKQLLQARYSAANTGGYDSSTDTYTAAGKSQLRQASQAYARYASLVGTPSADMATLGATAYGETEQFSAASNAWQAILKASPSNRRALQCTAITATAAGDTRVGTLAADKFEGELSKTAAKEFKSEVADAKKSKAFAAEAC